MRTTSAWRRRVAAGFAALGAALVSSASASATASGQVTFDGVVLVDGPANHPTRPAPFIRVDTEK